MYLANSIPVIIGAATPAIVAEAAKKEYPSDILHLPWGVIAAASCLAGLVAVVAYASRKANEGEKLTGIRWVFMEYAVGCVAGVAVWAGTEMLPNVDPKLQLLGMIIAGWQARDWLNKHLPAFWKRLTGSNDK